MLEVRLRVMFRWLGLMFGVKGLGFRVRLMYLG